MSVLTEQEKRLVLCEYALGISITNIARKAHHHIHYISDFLRTSGIDVKQERYARRKVRRRHITDEEAILIRYEYSKGMPVEKIARKLHCRYALVSNFLWQSGIDIAKERAKRIGDMQRGRPKLYITADNNRKISALVTVAQWAYIAGIFDGEGCLRQDNKWGNWRVTITQKGDALHEWLLSVLGVGTITEKYGHAGCKDFRISAQKEIYQFLLRVQPYCIVKREKVSQAIIHLEGKYKWGCQET